MITIRPFQKSDLKEVLALSKRSSSTNRTHDTWQSNNMTAILAFDGSRLIGAIPLEPRSFSLGDKKLINILWVSGAHVDLKYRGQGIGTAMDQKIKECFSPKFKAILVYRGDETSQAYRWYKKIGYHEFLPILSFKRKVEKPDSIVRYMTLQNGLEIRQWEDTIYNCFNECNSAYGGFPQRHRRFWSDKFNTHYYREFYNYSLLVLRHRDTMISYAFLGQTDMKDSIKRIDILEIVSMGDNISKKFLYNAIMDYAYKCNLKEIRIQLSFQDPNLIWMKSLGFINRWRTNIMGKIFDPIDYFKDCLSKSIDLEQEYRFSIQTPVLGIKHVGQGKKTISLFTHDDVFNKMLFGRCNITNAIEEGKIVVLGGEERVINIFKTLFPLNNWRYFHIDYI